MEFDTGPDTQPGHDITVETSSGSTDLGAATYDSDHDGVADSVIVIDGADEYVVTDSDHDGTADAMHVYNSSGQEIDPDTGATLGAGDPSSDTGDDAGSNATSDTGDHLEESQSGGHDITMTGDDGSSHLLGAATVDMDQDGSPDTAVVHNDDGSVTGYTDRDGDGRADQITQVDAAGNVVIATADGSGGWEVASTGHLDADGRFVPTG